MANSADSRAATLALIARGHEEYDIFYGKYLSNHMSHGLIAVYGLGGTPKRLEEFWDVHSEHDVLGMKLEPARKPTFTIDNESWRAHLGEQDSYPEYFQFFQKELQQKGLKHCVEEYMPRLVKQVAAHAFHPFIHLGFSLYFARSGLAEGELTLGDSLIPLTEGFAACAVADMSATGMHAGLPPDSTNKEGDLLHCVGEIFEKPELSDVYNEGFTKANFSQRLLILKATIGPHLVSMVNQWYFDVLGSAEAIADKEKQRALLQHVGRTAFAAHWGMQCKDFFLLHGVTAFFSLVQVVKTLTCPEAISQTILNFAYSLLLAYAVVGAPTLRPLSQLEDCGSSWDQIVDIVRPDGSEKNDEHMLKLVFVSRELESLFDTESDRMLVRATAKEGAEYPFYTSSHYSFNEGLRQRGVDC